MDWSIRSSDDVMCFVSGGGMNEQFNGRLTYRVNQIKPPDVCDVNADDEVSSLQPDYRQSVVNVSASFRIDTDDQLLTQVSDFFVSRVFVAFQFLSRFRALVARTSRNLMKEIKDALTGLEFSSSVDNSRHVASWIHEGWRPLEIPA